MKNNPKLYVGCGLTNAPQSFRDDVEALKLQLQKEYNVLHFLGTVAGTAADVYRWDIEECVANCEVFLAICDHDSTGLGWELSQAIAMGKPVLGVAHKDASVSRLIIGAAEVKSNFSFERYNDLLADVPGMLAAINNEPPHAESGSSLSA